MEPNIYIFVLRIEALILIPNMLPGYALGMFLKS